MDNIKLAELLFPDVTETVEDLEKKYPPRTLAEGAKVTRIAPSPTGYMHLGNLYGALIDERLAHQSNGIFYLRIEDTDQKREIEGAVQIAVDAMRHFGLYPDEGVLGENEEKGDYGPYTQSNRAMIYKIVAKHLTAEGLAYPCFCTQEQTDKAKEEQQAQTLTPGYYGKWAYCRDLTFEQVKENINAGKTFIVRLRTPGNIGGRLKHFDLVRGEMEIDENYNDIPIIKSDGLPTYHFAHVVDDHFMRTTHVVRGEEWLSTLPRHLQMFDMLGWKRPKYIHTSHLLKSENGGKRKLSKRKDPELGLQYYDEMGYPVKAVKEYVMTLLNSNFEEWRIANPDAPIESFSFSVKKLSASGALFDMDKLRDVTKNTVSRMSAEDVYEELTAWAEKYDKEFYELLAADRKYAVDILAIGRGGAKPRKDLCLWSEVKAYMDFFYDSLFDGRFPFPDNLDKADISAVLNKYAELYDDADSQDVWFDKIKALASELGYAAETKLYKKEPDKYKGHVGDIAMMLRVAVSGRQTSPDTYCVMQILGRGRVLERLAAAQKSL